MIELIGEKQEKKFFDKKIPLWPEMCHFLHIFWQLLTLSSKSTYWDVLRHHGSIRFWKTNLLSLKWDPTHGGKPPEKFFTANFLQPPICKKYQISEIFAKSCIHIIRHAYLKFNHFVNMLLKKDIVHCQVLDQIFGFYLTTLFEYLA